MAMRRKVTGRLIPGVLARMMAIGVGGLLAGGELKFSIRDFLAPNGRRLEGRGVEPDIPVIYHINDLRAGRDPGIDTALRALVSQLAKPGS